MCKKKFKARKVGNYLKWIANKINFKVCNEGVPKAVKKGQ